MLGKWIAQYQENVEKSKSLLPRFPSYPKLKKFKPNYHAFNFILLHYIYIIACALLGSVLIYAPGSISYVDALFFASGASTQAGLNTIDVNKLFLYQQIVMMFIACIANPIWINSFVVFVRLYWFEKRFQNIAKDARAFRKTRTRSQTKSEAKEDTDFDNEERGVNGRQIKVLHQPDGVEAEPTANGSEQEKTSEDDGAEEHVPEPEEGLNPPKRTGTGISPKTQQLPFTRDIVFADEIGPQNGKISNDDRVPPRRTQEEHKAFVENQRNPKDKGALRIPGPRDFDRGDVPRRVEEDEDDEFGRGLSRDLESREGDATTPGGSLSKHHRPFWNRHISIDDPNRAVRYPSFMNRRRRHSIGEGTSGDAPKPFGARSRTLSFMHARTQEREERDPMPYLSYAATLGRNSAFVDLTEEQREELGGIEYRSLKTLAWVLIVYYFGFHLLGLVILLPWIMRSDHYKSIVSQFGVAPAWWGVWTPASMFNDLGFTLTPDSMISFQSAALPLLIGTFLIIVGNTGFPCMLRLIIWFASKCAPYGSSVWEELRFLLDHPRRCFTLLFPKRATWWLFWILVALNGIDLIFFIILDLNDETVTSLPVAIRLLDGLFQAASTRTAGFSAVNLADLHPGIQVSYLIMMYISVFPIAISIRRTNVYEEKSLGIYGSSGAEDETAGPGSEPSYVSSHLRRQLSFDLWYIFLGLFLICVIEGDRLENVNEPLFTIFSVLFEIISAYGTVGLSLGYPNVNASFCSQFRPLSKLIIIAMMIRGRHRGLPYALDRAILLPSESLAQKEAKATRRIARRINTVVGEGQQDAALEAEEQLAAQGRARKVSVATHQARRPVMRGIKRVVTGALSAGPAIKRGKRA